MTEQICFPREKVQSWEEYPYVWFGCTNRGNGNGSKYVLPANWTDVEEYSSDTPGVRFIMDGILFRNVTTPHKRRKFDAITMPTLGN